MISEHRIAAGFVGLQAIVCAVVLVAIGTGRMPLGVPGEWEWQRSWFNPTSWDIFAGLTVSAGYATIAALGHRFLTAKGGAIRETLAVAVLAAAAVLAQIGWIFAAPQSCGFERWGLATLFSGPSGYYAKAAKMEDFGQFLIDYPDWIETQDVLHTGTHPPGLFATCYGIRRLMEERPDWALAIARNLPSEVQLGFQAYDSAEKRVTPPSDRAAVTLIGLFTMLASALTAVPLYLLARISLGDPRKAWFAACFWPAVPAALLFQPVSDAFYPMIATVAYAMAAGAARAYGSSKSVGGLLAAGSGVVLALGMGFTLAFLAAGLVVGLIEAIAPRLSWRGRLALLIATGLGFLASVLAVQWSTGFDPWRTWLANQANHSRFYQEYPRSYWPWIAVNPLELLIALGLPAALWALAGVRTAGREAASAAIVLILLNLSGRNLGEVARLWLPLMPPLLIAAGAGSDFGRLRAGWKSLGGSILLAGLVVVALEALVQGVYPAEAFQELQRNLP